MATFQRREGKGGTSYRVTIRLKGPPPDSATFRRLTDAKRWAVETEAAIRAGRYFGVTRRRTFDLLRMWRNKIEGWILEQVGMEQQSTDAQGLRVVKGSAA